MNTNVLTIIKNAMLEMLDTPQKVQAFKDKNGRLVVLIPNKFSFTDIGKGGIDFNDHIHGFGCEHWSVATYRGFEAMIGALGYAHALVKEVA